MNYKTLLAVLLISGALASPAYANYFSNPFIGISLNVGSAPNPTPADIRVDRLPTVAGEPGALQRFFTSMIQAITNDKSAPAIRAAQPQLASGATSVAADSQAR